MEFRQSHSSLLPHAQPLIVTLLPLPAANIRLWSDILLMRNCFMLPFLSTILLPYYRWRGQRVYSGGFLVPNIPSNMIHYRRFPAIYRYFKSNYPPGFFGVTRLAHNFFRRFKCQIVGSSVSFPGILPPPTPSSDAATQPINPGSPMTNSFAVTGSRVSSFRSVLQYWNF